MRRTPDPKTAKRGRSEEQQTPNNRQRTSSADEFSTPAWKSMEAAEHIRDQTRGQSTPLGRKVLHNLEAVDNMEKSDWNKSMNEDNAVSSVLQLFGRSTDIEPGTEETEIQASRRTTDNNLGTEETGTLAFGRTTDNEQGTDEMETLDDVTINRMIQQKLNLRELEKIDNDEEQSYEGDNMDGVIANEPLILVPGVKKLTLTAGEGIQQDQFLSSIQQAIGDAVKEAIKPLMVEIKMLKQQITDLNIRNTNGSDTLPTPKWPRQISPEVTSQNTSTKTSANEKALNLAKRCIGFGPINHSMVSKHAEVTNTNLDQHTRNQLDGAFAVRNFLCKEMGMNDYEAENIRIIRTFRLNNNEEDLFAELGNESHIRSIRSKASNLSNGRDKAADLYT